MLLKRVSEGVVRCLSEAMAAVAPPDGPAMPDYAFSPPDHFKVVGWC